MIALIEKYEDKKQVALKWFLNELICLNLWQHDPSIVDLYRVKNNDDASELAEIYQVAVDAIKAMASTRRS